MTKLYNNQKSLRFVAAPKDKNHTCITWNTEAFKEALTELTPTAFKVYAYLGVHKEEKDPLAISRVDITKQLCISESTYHRTIIELQEKKYLIPDPEANDGIHFIFFEKRQDFRINEELADVVRNYVKVHKISIDKAIKNIVEENFKDGFEDISA